MSDPAKKQQAQTLEKWASEQPGLAQADQNFDSLNPGNIFANHLLQYTSHGHAENLRLPGGSLRLRACWVPAQ